MMLLGLVCLVVAAAALPTPESPRKVYFTVPNGMKADKNVVEFAITPQETGLEAKPETGFFVPEAPQLPPLYLFTFEKSNPTSPEGNKDENKKDNEEDKKPEEGKDTEEKLQLVRIDIFTQVLEPAVSLVFGVVNDLLGLLFSSDGGEQQKRSYYMVMTQ